MNILALTKYDRSGASSRLRFYQYDQSFVNAGHSLDIAPLLPKVYLNQKYSSKVSWLFVLKCYWHRFILLLRSRHYDILWVEKELFPYVPLWLERLCLPGNGKLVLDYDDAVFHNYDLHPSFFIRWLLRGKLDKLMGKADLVVGGNVYLCNRAKSSGSEYVQNIPTVVDKYRYAFNATKKKKHSVDDDTVTVGWIGSPSTVHYLKKLESLLCALKETYKFNCMAVGARSEQVQDSVFRSIQWSEETEVELVSEMDVGLMPLDDTPWEEGKCGYKLIQYMACGIPVIASAVGANKDIVEHGVTGYLVNTDSDWAEALKALLMDPELRKKMGQAGRQMVEDKYSLQVQSTRLIAAFSGLLANEVAQKCVE